MRAGTVFTASLILLVLAIAANIVLLAIIALIATCIGVFMIMNVFHEAGDRRSRLRGESVWQAAGRQGHSGRTGFGLVLGIALLVLMFVAMFNGAAALAPMFLGMAYGAMSDYLRK